MKSPAAETIVIHRLSRSYAQGSVKALDGVSLSIAAGELFGLLGPNGAGKTTLISILSGLLGPTGGEFSILGLDGRREFRSIRKHIGVVPQEIALYEKLTARENFLFFGRMLGLGGTRLKTRIAACLALTGLEKTADRKISTFSGGMKRRANLVVGLLHEPSILLLDEPTVGIDAQSRNLILETLEGLNRKGVTMIYTTHYMEEAERLCTRIAILDAGKIVAHGATAELLSLREGCRDLEALFLHLTGRSLRD